jgi:hypothetical protein
MSRRSDRIVAILLALGVLVQGVGVALLGRLEGREIWQVGVVSLALAVLVAEAWLVRMRLNHRVDMLLVMGVFGGIGMLAGWWLDVDRVAPPRTASFHAAMGHGCGGSEVADASDPHAACRMGGTHSGKAGPFSMVWSWMTGLMLIAAIPTGLVLTRCAALARSGWRRWVSTHIVGNALMVVGMVVIGHWLGPGMAQLTGSNVLGGHVAMLVGMLVGMELGMFAGEAALGLKPWQEWRWGSA